jgi:hypothetical protein
MGIRIVRTSVVVAKWRYERDPDTAQILYRMPLVRRTEASYSSGKTAAIGIILPSAVFLTR